MRQVSRGLDHETKLAKKHRVKIAFGTDLFGAMWENQNKEFGVRLRWFSSVGVLRQATSISAGKTKWAVSCTSSGSLEDAVGSPTGGGSASIQEGALALGL